MEEVVWKTINGYDGYEVSDDGRVYNTKTDKFLNGTVNNCGYLTITLRKDKKSKQFPMHRLVALAFIPNPDKKEYVRHRDSDNLNNEPANLYWMSYEEYREWDHKRMWEKADARKAEAEKAIQQARET